MMQAKLPFLLYLNDKVDSYTGELEAPIPRNSVNLCKNQPRQSLSIHNKPQLFNFSAFFRIRIKSHIIK